MQMVNYIRMHCKYEDEYILDKPLIWVQNTYELCLMENHNNNLKLAMMVMQVYGAAMSEGGKLPKTYEEIVYDMRYRKGEIDEVPTLEQMQSIGLAVKESTYKKEKEEENSTEVKEKD